MSCVFSRLFTLRVAKYVVQQENIRVLEERYKRRMGRLYNIGWACIDIPLQIFLMLFNTLNMVVAYLAILVPHVIALCFCLCFVMIIATTGEMVCALPSITQCSSHFDYAAMGTRHRIGMFVTTMMVRTTETVCKPYVYFFPRRVRETIAMYNALQ